MSCYNSLLATLAAVLFCLVIAPTLSSAQTITATIAGTVTDPNGAVVPNAIITATSNDTGLAKTATADSEGRYTVPFLQPGVYSIAVEAAGFGQTTRPEVKLEVAQTATLDFTLTIGGSQTVVEVTDSTTPLLVTESSGLENTIENKLIDELPSAQRSTLAFVNLVPGTIDGGFALASGDALNTNGNASGGPIGSPGNRNFFDSNFSVGGGQSSTNDILLDGVSNTVGDFNGVAISPPQDSVREFKVLSGAYSAEYGRSGGGIINFITRSGGKDFNGTLYEYFQNGGLNANGWQRNSRGRRPDGSEVLPRIPIKRNQFGGTIGGPVYLPRFGEGGPALLSGKDSTFFFFNYEGRREQNPFSREITLPTARMRTGDLSELFTGATRAGITDTGGAAARVGQIYNPYGALVGGRRQAFANNDLSGLPRCAPGPRTGPCLDPIALNVLSFVPLPNRPGLINNYVFSDTAEFTRDILAVRIDTTISERQNLFGRFSYEIRNQAEPNYFETLAANVRRIRDQFGNFTLNHVYTITPSVINNIRYGYTRVRANQVPISEGFDPTQLGLPSYIANTAPILAFPIFTFSGGAEGQGLPGEITGGDQIGGSGNNQPRDTTTVADAVTIIRGNHTIRTGVEYRLLRFFAFQFNSPAGRFGFSRNFTRGPDPNNTPTNATDTGSSLASFLLGLPASGAAERVSPTTEYHHYGAGFIQDDYKVTSSLTLNLGLRYDIETGTAEVNQQITSFDLDAPSQLRGRVPAPTDAAVRALRPNFTDLRGLLSFPDGPQSRANKNRFAPRIGFAYKINDKTTVRGGYGVYYVPLTVEQPTALGNVFTTNFSLVTEAGTGQIQQPGSGAAPTAFLTDPFPGGLTLPPGNTLGADTQIGQNPLVVEPNRRTSYVQQYNFVVQRELARNLVIDISYAGNHGVRLPIRQLNLNQLPPEFIDYARSQVGNSTTAISNFFSQQVENPFFGIITNPLAIPALRSRTVPREQLLKPYPQYNALNLFNPLVGASKYNSLQISLQKRFSDGLSATANYTFSKALDLGSSGTNTGFLPGVGTSIENVYNIADEYAISNFDVPHRFVASFVYELPFGRGRRFGGEVNRFVNAVLGDFQVSGTATYQAGSPIPITSSGAFLGSATRRPDRIPGVEAGIDADQARENVRNGSAWFNTAAFAQPADFTFGNAARNYSDVRRDGYRNWDISVAKNFNFNEGAQRLQFRSEFLNAFNNLVFGTPGTNVSVQNTFGLITTQGNTPRIIQFVLRFTY